MAWGSFRARLGKALAAPLPSHRFASDSTMKTSATLLLATLLPLAANAALQDPFGRPTDTPEVPGLQDEMPAPGEEKVEPRDIFGRARTGKNSSLARELVGCWQVFELKFDGLAEDNREELGYLLVGKEFMSFELQVSWQWTRDQVPDAYQTFMGEYRLEPGGRIRMTSLIGSILAADGLQLEWTRPGQERIFHVEMPTPNMLELHFENGGRVSLVRKRRSALDAFIFGEEDPSENVERDVLGRSVPKGEREGANDEGSEGEVDIFGRPIQKGDEESRKTPEEILTGNG